MNAHEYELSHELELELEGESHELSHELELELEGGSHELHEHEQEAEQFFGALAGLAGRAFRSPALRRLALQAAKSVLAPGDGEGEFEHEFEYEVHEQELELELNPVRRVYLDAMMEHMGHAAAEAETEQEAAEAFLPLIPLAMKALPIAGKLAMKFGPKILKGASRLVPQLSRGIRTLSRTLHRSPTGRQLLRAVPQIARGTAAQIARRIAAGRPMSGRQAVRMLAGQTARVLGSPQRLTRVWRRSRALDRRHHQTHPGTVRPRRWRWVNGRRYPIHQRALPAHVPYGHAAAPAPYGNGHAHGHVHTPPAYGAPPSYGYGPYASPAPAPVSYTTPSGQVCTCTPAAYVPPPPVGCAGCGR
jgi:hypothetical protein